MTVAAVMMVATLTAELWWYGIANPLERRSGARRPSVWGRVALAARGFIGLKAYKTALAVLRLT
jgi:hypothetical protein